MLQRNSAVAGEGVTHDQPAVRGRRRLAAPSKRCSISGRVIDTGRELDELAVEVTRAATGDLDDRVAVAADDELSVEQAIDQPKTPCKMFDVAPHTGRDGLVEVVDQMTDVDHEGVDRAMLNDPKVLHYAPAVDERRMAVELPLDELLDDGPTRPAYPARDLDGRLQRCVVRLAHDGDALAAECVHRLDDDRALRRLGGPVEHPGDQQPKAAGHCPESPLVIDISRVLGRIDARETPPLGNRRTTDVRTVVATRHNIIGAQRLDQARESIGVRIVQGVMTRMRLGERVSRIRSDHMHLDA